MYFQMQSLTQQTSPVPEKPKQNTLSGGTTQVQGRVSDPDPLLASLLVPTNASWGGNSELLVCLFYCFSPPFTFYDRDVIALAFEAKKRWRG